MRTTDDLSTQTIINKITDELELPVVVATVLAARGHSDVDEIKAFLAPSLERDWVEPQKIYGLLDVAEALERAVLAKRHIVVYGDFDVDGLTATAVMMLGLQELGAVVDYFIPNRIDEGYGMTPDALERLLALKPDTVVTVDCGISAGKEIKTLCEQGVEVIVTDHHEPGEDLPLGVPICNPKLTGNDTSGDTLGDKLSGVAIDIAGVMVALKVIFVLGERMGQPKLWRKLIDLAALGTIADLMPLQGENRALVAQGMRMINQSPRPGIAAVHATLKPGYGGFKATNLAFGLIPRLNAAGRLGSPDRALELLLAQDTEQAASIAQHLEAINIERRAIESKMAAEALDLAAELDPQTPVIVLANDGWHEGVKGIVASRVVNAYKKPAIIFTIEGDMARGSGRSHGGVNLYKLVEQVKEHTQRFGGHEGAIGVTVALSELDAFVAALHQSAATLDPSASDRTHSSDVTINLGDLALSDIEQLDILEPFGKENEPPIFRARKVFITNPRAVGASRTHLSFTATGDLSDIAAIWFNCPDIERFLHLASAVDIRFSAEVECYRERKQVKCMVKDVIVPQTHRPDPQTVQTADTDELLKALGSEHIVLRPTQDRALDALVARQNTLAVMPTGAGKSLIFYVHAARVALQEGRSSIFIYPLRALINDQHLHVAELFANAGLQCAVLMGNMTPATRQETIDGWREGRTDILLTTPEYLVNQLAQIPSRKALGFIVVDEAHHIATATSDFRAAYKELGSFAAAHPQATVLALTATAPQSHARDICAALNIQRVITDNSVREALGVYDKRNFRDRKAYLSDLVTRSPKILVFVNTRLESIELTRALRKLLPAKALSIGYYHGGMPSKERSVVQADFISGQLTCLVATSAFGEGVNISDIRDVVLYTMPYSLLDLNQSAGRVGRDGEQACVHLLYNRKDVKTNDYVLSAIAPNRELLVSLYKYIKELAKTPQKPNDSLAKIADNCFGHLRERISAKEVVLTGLRIFEELGFLDLQVDGDKINILFTNAPQHSDLSNSVRYCEGQDILLTFAQFKKQAFSDSAAKLLTRINSALLPDDIDMLTPKTGEGGEL